MNWQILGTDLILWSYKLLQSGQEALADNLLGVLESDVLRFPNCNEAICPAFN